MGALAGAALTAISNSISTAVQVNQSKKAAKRNRQFQRNMRNTQMQARVVDLQKAGLNPILAAGGPGAHSPAGTAEQVPDIGNQGRKSVESLREAVLAASRLKTETTARKLAESQAKLQGEKVATEKTQQDLNLHSAREVAIRAELLETELPGKRQIERLQTEVPILKWGNAIRRALSGAKE